MRNRHHQYESARQRDESRARVERVRARLAAGIRLVEPTVTPPTVERVGPCHLCGRTVVRTAEGLACFGVTHPDHKPRRKPLTDRQVWTRMNRLIRQTERAAEQAVEESDGDLSEDDAAHDIGICLAMQEPPAVRAAFFRGYLGWDPDADADLYRREATDPRLAR